MRKMNCKNCGRELEVDSIFCQHCGTKLESNVHNTGKKGKWIVVLIGIVAIVLIFVNLTKEIEKEIGTDKVVLISEKAETEDGDLIYEIKYEYDKYGDEVRRTAYDTYGNEDDSFLKYAGDLQPFLDNYWRMELEKGEQSTGYFKMKEDYIYTYNQSGYLTRCDFLKDNALNIYAIIFEYETIKVQGRKKDKDEQASEDIGVITDANTISLKNKLGDEVGIINAGGEECYALWGETGALVWKYVDATFEEEAYIASSFARDVTEFTYSDDANPSEWGWDATRINNWHKWINIDEFTPVHIGDDIFLFEGYLYGEYYFGYYIDAINGWSYETNELVLEDDRDSFTRMTNFNDGYAVGVYTDNSYDDNGNYLAVMDKWGNVTKLNVDIMESRNVMGEYSDGLMYCNGRFYNMDSYSILNINNKDWGSVYTKPNVYMPYFKDGVCTLITFKNNKYWIFDINKNGEVLTEIKEFDLNELNY